MCSVILSFVAGLTFSASAAGDDAVERIKVQLEQQRQATIRKLERELALLKDGKTLAGVPSHLPKSKQAEFIAETERTLLATMNLRAPIWPNLSSALAVGVVGRFPAKGQSFAIRVRTIVNEDEMLIAPADQGVSVSGGIVEFPWTPVWVKGISTKGLVDNAPVAFGEQVFVVTGTKQYKTVGGGSKTVFQIEPLASEIVMQVEKETKIEADRISRENEAKEKARRAAEAKAEADAKLKTENDAKAAALTKAENAAAVLLKFARDLAKDGKPDLATKRLEQILADYPDTKAATEAKKLLGR